MSTYLFFLLFFDWNKKAQRSPRLSIQPLLHDSDSDQTLIWFNTLKKNDIKQYTDKLDKWLNCELVMALELLLNLFLLINYSVHNI